MPILTQPTTPPAYRRPWLWVLLGVPGVVLVLLVSLVAWSWDHPVEYITEQCGLCFGGWNARTTAEWEILYPGTVGRGNWGKFVFVLPDHSLYLVIWREDWQSPPPVPEG